MNRSMLGMLGAAAAVYLAGAVIHVRADGGWRSWQDSCSTCIAGSAIARPASMSPLAVGKCKADLAAACGSACAESLSGDAYCSPPPVTPTPPTPLRWWERLLPWRWFD